MNFFTKNESSIASNFQAPKTLSVDPVAIMLADGLVGVGAMVAVSVPPALTSTTTSPAPSALLDGIPVNEETVLPWSSTAFTLLASKETRRKSEAPLSVAALLVVITTSNFLVWEALSVQLRLSNVATPELKLLVVPT